MSERPQVLVTGGSGYFGTTLVRELLSRGHDVRIFDLHPPEGEFAAVPFHRGDIRDLEAVRRAASGAGVVYHCVAQVPVARDRALFWSVNRDGTRNLLQAAQEHGVAKVVYISSSAVFGIPRDAPITARTEPAPAEDYGAAKFAGEQLCRQFADRGLDVTIVRPRTIMGHGRLGIMQVLFEWVCQGRNVYVLGRGDNRYQFVHAEDLAAACVLASARPGFAAYNVGAESVGTMRETLQAVVDHARTGSRVRSLPHSPAVAAMKLTGLLRLSPLAPYHWLVYGREVYFDISKPRQELNWRPRWDYRGMFIQSFEWYRRHREEVLRAKGRSAHQSRLREGVLRLLRWV
jgi:nucleoside-diphosphate-sugar epimerase